MQQLLTTFDLYLPKPQDYRRATYTTKGHQNLEFTKNLSITSAPSGDSRIVLAIGSVIPSTGLNWLVTIIVTGVALANVGDIRGAGIRDRCGIFDFEKVLDSVPKMLMTVK